MRSNQPNARAEEVQQQRRRRSGTLAGLKLGVPEGMKDPDKEYRWANDKDNRLSDLTEADDWDIVRNPAIEGQGEGTPVTRNVGTHEGKPMKAYLIAKPKALHEADKRAKLTRIAADEDEIRRGGIKHLSSESREDLAGVYTPGGRNIIDGR